VLHVHVGLLPVILRELCVDDFTLCARSTFPPGEVLARSMRREKGKKGKVKHTESREPPHNPCWQRVRLLSYRAVPHFILYALQALQQKSWVRPVEALPDASLWPTWVALREHLLSNVIEVRSSPEPSLIRN
jgi:hypothetical protein